MKRRVTHDECGGESGSDLTVDRHVHRGAGLYVNAAGEQPGQPGGVADRDLIEHRQAALFHDRARLIQSRAASSARTDEDDRATRRGPADRSQSGAVVSAARGDDPQHPDNDDQREHHADAEHDADQGVMR